MSRPPESASPKGPLVDIKGRAIDPPKSSKASFSFNIAILLSSAVLAASVLIYMAWSSTPSDSIASKTTFALCSQDGRRDIYTVDAHNTQVQCLVVHDDLFIDVGDLDGISKRWENHWSELLNASTSLPIRYIPKGAMVVPGISDSHGHILEYGAMTQLPLEGTRSIAETVDRVREYILSSPALRNDTTQWIRGGGWDHTVWPEGFPTAADLEADPIVRGRRIVLQSKDCHALWLSDLALRQSLPFPASVEGGVIQREEGTPTGLLLDNAQELCKQPELTDWDLEERFNTTVTDALKVGLTSIHDAGLDPASLAFFKRRAARGKLPIRLYGMTYFNEDDEYWGNTTEKIIDAAGGTLTQRAVKIFTGALRTGGAALHAPYADNPSTSGFLTIDPKVLYEKIPLFLRDGWQVNVHAIGDLANGVVLDVFESALNGVDVAALRPRLEHAQIMTRDDMKRLGKLGVIASIQPTHATSDMSYAEDRLGPERVKNLYAFRSMIDSGARVTFGSDFPVESINPLSGFYAAISRLSPDGNSPHGPDGWFPEQRLTREEALRAMTIDPAHASYTESTLGSIEGGKKADFVILDQDIMTIPMQHILKTKVLATVIDGQAHFGSLEDPKSQGHT